VTGLALVLAGLLAKAALVPFHSWAPDVVEGAPAPVAGLLCVAPMIMAMLVLVRWVGPLGAAGDVRLDLVFAPLVIASIVVGSAMALIQHSVARMLAYLTIVQAGLGAIAFTVAGAYAFGALLFHLIAHGFALLGAFAVVASLASARCGHERIEDFSGLARRSPRLAAAMTLFLLCLAGFPGTAGFWARFQLFGAAMEGGSIACVIVAALGNVVVLASVLRIVVAMYMREGDGEAPALSLATNEIAVLLVCAGAVVYLGLQPDPSLPGQGVGLIELLLESVPASVGIPVGP
jgi:NADH-quinone oxidoreductase subunit N